MTHLSNKRRSCDSLRALGVVSDHVTAGTLECFLLLCCMLVTWQLKKKFQGFFKNLWVFFNVKSLTRGQTGRNTHKDGATNYSICLSIQLKPFDREFLKVCLVKNKAITILTDRSLR